MARMPKPTMNIVKEVGNVGSAYGFDIEMEPSALIMVASFNKLGLDIRSFKEPLHRSIKIMGPSFQQNFDVSGRPTKWAPLADETIQRKAKEGASRPSAPLIRTGLLQKEVGYQKIWKIDGIEGYAAVDNLGNAPYGVIHQQGIEGEEVGFIRTVTGQRKLTDTAGSGSGRFTVEVGQLGGIPQREFLAFQKQDEKAIEDIFIKWFQERAAAAGFRPGASGLATLA